MTQFTFWALAGLCAIGAAAVVLSRDVMRLALGLGMFLVGVAGFFALFGFGFLALAEIFVYVGGVLVLVLFAIMLVHRSRPGQPSLSSRHDLLAFVACAGLFGFLLVFLRSIAPEVTTAATGGPDALGDILLGEMLPQFELAGVLLLTALVAVVSVSGGDDR